MVIWFSDNPVFIRFAPCVHIKMNSCKSIQNNFFNSFQSNLCSYIASLLVFLHRDIDIRDSIRHCLYSLKSLGGQKTSHSVTFQAGVYLRAGGKVLVAAAAVFQSVSMMDKAMEPPQVLQIYIFTRPESLCFLKIPSVSSTL